MKKTPTLKEQEKHLNRKARSLGLVFKNSDRVSPSKYSMVHSRVTKITGVKCKSNEILVDPVNNRKLERRVMNKRHELVEIPLMRKYMAKGMSQEEAYRKAHAIANRKQRTVDAVR